MNKTIKRRLVTPVDGDVPLAERLDLRRLKAALDEPLYMDAFVAKDDEERSDIPKKAFNSCGTIGCIAGNVLLNELPKTKRSRGDVCNLRGGLDYTEAAGAILRMTYAEADTLFSITFPSCTPGTKTYTAEVTRKVKGWLKAQGVKW